MKHAVSEDRMPFDFDGFVAPLRLAEALVEGVFRFEDPGIEVEFFLDRP